MVGRPGRESPLIMRRFNGIEGYRIRYQFSLCVRSLNQRVGGSSRHGPHLSSKLTRARRKESIPFGLLGLRRPGHKYFEHQQAQATGLLFSLLTLTCRLAKNLRTRNRVSYKGSAVL